MKMLLKYLHPVRWRITLGMIIKFLGSVMELFLPYLLAYLLDTVVPKTKTDGNIRPIFFYMGIMLICSALAVVFNIVANRMAAATTRDAVQQIRQDLFDRTMRLSDRKINEFSIPTLEMRLTGDTYNIHRMVGMLQRMGVRAPILLLGGLALTTFMEPVLTLTLVALLPLVAVVVISVSKKGIPLYTQLQQHTDDMVRVVRENITGIRVIKALSRTEYEKQRFHDINETVSNSETKAGVTMALTNPIMTFLLNGGLALVILVGAYRVNLGLSQVGKIIAFMSYFTIILNAMMSISRMFIMTTKGLASAQRIAEVLNTGEETEDLPVIESDETREGMLVFEDVSFSYNGNRNNLEHISFSLKRGGTLGVIGATGCGKSTLIKLLMRFYDADSGRIFIDGKDIRSIPFKDLRKKFGVVMQNDFLYADTIEDNIAFQRQLTPAQLEKAVQCAQADEFVGERGMDSKLTASGNNLSGGQKQRLLVARAVAGEPEILLLDDASSALDYKTDAQMRSAVFSMSPRPTTVIVAQRVSSVMNSDLILVLDDGKCTDMGTHEQLMKNSEIYREIARTQMGGEHHGERSC